MPQPGDQPSKVELRTGQPKAAILRDQDVIGGPRLVLCPSELVGSTLVVLLCASALSDLRGKLFRESYR